MMEVVRSKRKYSSLITFPAADIVVEDHVTTQRLCKASRILEGLILSQREASPPMQVVSIIDDFAPRLSRREFKRPYDRTRDQTKLRAYRPELMVEGHQQGRKRLKYSQEAESAWGSFIVLPVEIVLHLMSYLDGKGVCQMRQASSELNRLGKDDRLWGVICKRAFGVIPNRLPKTPYGKSWEWIYRSKAIVYQSKEQIKDGAVCCYLTKDCRYEGEWRNGELEGYSIELWSDGEQYEGWSTQGRLNGYGRASYASGDVYVGMWKNGLRAGGTYLWSDGWRYEGEYRDGKLTGMGTLLFKDGSKYVGEWDDGNRHGQGRMTYTDGSRYEGQWKNDKRDGPGILYWPVRSLSSTNALSLDTLDPIIPSGQQFVGEHKFMRYEGFWREDRLIDGGKVCWDDGTTQSLEDALKRLN